MKIFLINYSCEVLKYALLEQNVISMIERDSGKLVSQTCEADVIVAMGSNVSERLNQKEFSPKPCPIVRVLYRSDIGNNLYIDDTYVDFTITIKDLDVYILSPYPHTSMQIPVPFEMDATSSRGFKKTDLEYDIYVNTREFMLPDSALCKLIRSLNRLTKYRILVCTGNRSIGKVLNSNITVTDHYMDIEEDVMKSKMVIGSGYAILFALKYRKPVIVAGERGYAGMPNIHNLEKLYSEFFQGTIGGRLDGPIPERLVLEDVDSIFQGNYTDLAYELNDLLAPLNRLLLTAFEALKREDSQCSSIKFNTNYTIIKGNGKYWLLNRITRQILATLKDEHINVINRLSDENAGQKSQALSEVESKAYEEMINNNILIKVYSRGDTSADYSLSK